MCVLFINMSMIVTCNIIYILYTNIFVSYSIYEIYLEYVSHMYL